MIELQTAEIREGGDNGEYELRSLKLWIWFFPWGKRSLYRASMEEYESKSKWYLNALDKACTE